MSDFIIGSILFGFLVLLAYCFNKGTEREQAEWREYLKCPCGKIDHYPSHYSLCPKCGERKWSKLVMRRIKGKWEVKNGS